MTCSGVIPGTSRVFVRPLLLFLWFVLLASGIGVPARAAAPAPPTHPGLARGDFRFTKETGPDKGGAEGDAAVTSNRYDVLHYGLDLRIDPETTSLRGAVQMVFASVFPDLQTFVCDLTTDLEITSVEHDTGSLPFTQAGDTVAITLPAALAPGAVDSLTIHYRGQPSEPSFSRGLMFRTYHLGGQEGPSVANMSQPAYAKYWWPCKDRPGDKAPATINLTVPEDLVAVSNGKLVGTSLPETGWKTYYWREDYPVASYLVSVAISDFVRLDDHCSTAAGSEIPIHNWVFPPDQEDAAVDFAPLCEMIDICEGNYGPYPFPDEKYGHAEFLWSGAMEHQTVTSIGYGALIGDGSHDWLIVHELGHQWFGDSLTPDTWADIWLNEGFATYTEALWAEHLGGSAGYLANMLERRSPGSWAVQGPVYDPMPVFPGRVIYDKGAWILHMLRGRLGDEVFFPMLEDWAQGVQRPLETVTTAEFISHVGDWAGQDLRSFFWPYLTSTAIPHVACRFTVGTGPAGPATRLEVHLQQVQTPLFDNVFPIRVTTSSGQTVFHLRLDQAAASAVFDLPAAVEDVRLDPDSWVLWDPVREEEPSEGLFAAFPNPSRDGYVQFRYQLDDPAQVVLLIYDALGREVCSRDLGLVSPQAVFNEVAWDEKDRDGRPVPSGIYWAALEIGGRRSVRKIAVVR